MVDRTLLVIADIGGYTRFLTVHRINLAHAQDVVARLLEAVIDGSRKLKLAKLEGDAALFFCAEKDQSDLAGELKNIRSTFEQKKQQMVIERLCSCEGCTQASDLTLKFVAHVGEVAVQRVKRFTELAGRDVIVVHRLLKNHVPLRQYLLATEAVRGLLPADLPLTSMTEDLEGIGVTATVYADLDALGPLDVAAPAVSASRRAFAWAGMTWRALPYLAGFKKACDGFQNFEPVRALPATTTTATTTSPTEP